MVSDGIIQKELQKDTPTGNACEGKMILQFRERSHVKKISFSKRVGSQKNQLEVIAVFFNGREISLCRFLFQGGLGNDVDGSILNILKRANQIFQFFFVKLKVLNSVPLRLRIGSGGGLSFVVNDSLRLDATLTQSFNYL